MLKTDRKLMVIIFSMLSASSLATENLLECEAVIFDCQHAGGEIKVCRSETQYLLMNSENDLHVQFNANAPQFEKSSYHRALVNEHSLTLSKSGFAYTFSDYQSEEMSLHIAELSVRIEQNNLVKNIFCEQNSVSGLAQLANTKEFPF